MPRYSKKGRVSFEKTAFGRLPPEIRANIYKHALTVPVPSNSNRFPFICPRHSYPGGNRKDGLIWYNPVSLRVTTRPSKWLKMLLVCRQMFNEAVRIWFQVNCLEFRGPTCLVNMAVNYPIRITYLRTIHIGEVYGHPFDLFRTLARCTSLTSLEIRLFELYGWSHNNTEWLLNCADDNVQETVKQIRGLQHMEFLVSEFSPEAKRFTGEFWVNKLLYVNGGWTRKHVDIANKMKAKMLRPKVKAPATEMSRYCKKRKAELENFNEEGDAKRRRIEE
ncbi:MAG: hypothetical protein Q9183_004776 [Haloplaca sp. 2 TL-2023]